MTMPSLINRTQSKELHTAFKKTYSELSQIALMFLNDNGISVSEYAVQNGLGRTVSAFSLYYQGGITLTSTGQGNADEDGNYISYYDMRTLNGKSFSGGANSTGRNSSFLCDNTGFRSSKNGAIYLFNDAPVEGKNGPVVCVDINGKKAPNRYGLDYFMFIFTVDGRVLPVGAEHANNPNACTSASGSCSNFNNVGSQYCSKTSNNIAYNASCAFYALSDTHPTQTGKSYWADFVDEVYKR